jgi:TRAP-type transport system periplasmic protein
MTFKQMLFGVSATAIMAAGTAQADTWRYAFEEAIDEVQGIFAQQFKEHVEANSDHEVQLFPFGTLGNQTTSWSRPRPGFCSS